MAEMMRSYVTDWLWSWVTWFFHSLGWGGTVTLIAAVLLAISLSFNVAKFLSRPKGMVISAFVVLVGLVFAWWTWPTAEASFSQPAPSDGVASVTQPAGQYAKQDAVVKPVQAPSAAVVVAKTGKKTAKKKQQAAQPLPLLAGPPLVVMPLPMGGMIFRLPPAVVARPPAINVHPKTATSIQSKAESPAPVAAGKAAQPAAPTLGKSNAAAPATGKQPMTAPAKPESPASVAAEKAAQPAAPTLGKSNVAAPATGKRPITASAKPGQPSPLAPKGSVNRNAETAAPVPPRHRYPSQWRSNNRAVEGVLDRFMEGEARRLMPGGGVGVPHGGGVHHGGGHHTAGRNHR